jgi:MoaA/NifB/PqqE/SkfB family radical SAM enzyme
MAEIGYIQVTRDCNLKCIICSNPPTNYHLEFDRAKEKIDALAAKQCPGVIMTGGEPTLYSSLPQLIKYCLGKKVFPRIITNGQKIADIEYLKLLKESGLRHLHLSVYSCYDEIQSYKMQLSLKYVRHIHRKSS